MSIDLPAEPASLPIVSSAVSSVVSSIEDVAIKTPCQMDWGLMDDVSGDERIRFCQHCTKNVYNISELKSEDAVALINEKEGDLCVRYFKRFDGTIVTADCRPLKRRVKAVGLRRWFQFSMASMLALLTASAGLCAAGPWIGTKFQPLVDRWFPPEVDEMLMEEMGDVCVIAPAVTTQSTPGSWNTGGFGGSGVNGSNGLPLESGSQE